MAAVNSIIGCEPKPPDCASSVNNNGPDRTVNSGQFSSYSELSSCQTVEEKLYNMPMEEYKKLLDGCKDKSLQLNSQQAEIISQLEHQTKVQPEEEIPTLTNSKYSSSLQSLHERGKSHPNSKVSSSSTDPTSTNNRSIGGDHPPHHHHHHHQSHRNHYENSESLNCQTTTSTTTITTASHSPYPHNNSNNSTTTTTNTPRNINNNNINLISSARHQYQQQNHQQDIPSRNETSTLEMDTMNNLPSQYFFNCALATLNSNLDMTLEEKNRNTFGATESQAVVKIDKPRNTAFIPREEDASVHRNANVQLNENYTSVSSCVTGKIPPKGQLDPLYDHHRTTTEVCSIDTNAAKSPSMMSGLISPGSTPGYQQQGFTSPSQNTSPPSSITGSRNSGTGGYETRKGDEKKPKKSKGNKQGHRETSISAEAIPGFRGKDEIDTLLEYVEGAAPTEKRGNKKKERESRVKSFGNETLVKSVSLDDDNLSLATKKSTDKSDNNNRSSSLHLKDAPGARSNQGRADMDKKEKGTKENQSSGVKKSVVNQSVRKDSDQEDRKSPLRENAEPKFTVVIRKRRNKTACSASETGSSGEKNANKESRRSGSRGERRKSVGSVPGSDRDGSDGSDDGSVRSLPAGKCSQKENVPKSSASSGGTPQGTPQTSYADIARLTKDEEAKREVPQALEDYPLLHASENSERGSDDDGSVRSLPVGEITPKETIKKSTSSSSGGGAGTPQTSWADIARNSKLSFHGGEDKKECIEKKGDRPAEEFPELTPTTVGSSQSDSAIAAEIVSCSSPKSDDGSSVGGPSKYANDNNAFPKLSASSGLKSSLSSQGPSSATTATTTIATTATTPTIIQNQKNVSNVVLAGSSQVITTNQKLPNSNMSSNSVQATRAVASKLSSNNSNNNNNGSVGVTSSHSPTTGISTSNTATTVTTNAAVIVNAATSSTIATTNSPPQSSINPLSMNTGKKSVPNVTTNITTASTINNNNITNNITSATVLNSPSIVSSDVESIPSATTTVSDSNNSSKVNSVIRNGKKKNKESQHTSVNGHLSDSERDKAVKRSDNVGAKSGKSAFSVTIPQPFVDQRAGQCTEAVVFCGENFKEPPQLPSKELQFEFGFAVNEQLVGMAKNVFENDDQTKCVTDNPTLTKETNEDNMHQQQPLFSSRDKNQSQPPVGRDRSNNQSVRVRNQAGMRDNKSPSVDVESRLRSQESRNVSSSSYYHDSQSGGKLGHHNTNMKKVHQAGGTLSESSKPNVPPQQHIPPESFASPHQGMVVTSIPLNPMNPQVHVNTGIPLVPPVFSVPAPFIPGGPNVPVTGIVPVMPQPYDPNQFPPVVYQTPPPSLGGNASKNTTPIQSQQYHHVLPANTPSSSRQSNQVSTSNKPGLCHHSQVPESPSNLPIQSNEFEQNTFERQHEQQQHSSVEYRTPTSTHLSTIVLEYPVNFAQYYLPPNSEHPVYQEFNTYMQTRAQFYERMAQNEPKRCRRVT